MEDLEATVALFNACSKELIDKEQHDVDETRVEWKPPKFNLVLRYTCFERANRPSLP